MIGTDDPRDLASLSTPDLLRRLSRELKAAADEVERRLDEREQDARTD